MLCGIQPTASHSFSYKNSTHFPGNTTLFAISITNIPTGNAKIPLASTIPDVGSTSRFRITPASDTSPYACNAIGSVINHTITEPARLFAVLFFRLSREQISGVRAPIPITAPNDSKKLTLYRYAGASSKSTIAESAIALRRS